ncbi:MAG TPA: hypothetical protein EYN70_03440 [Planctomycetaceae bacterium]|nr:hypothetical protein [Planctomycetaceae bacterium]
MPQQTRLLVAYFAVVVGVILLGLVAMFTHRQLGNWQYLLYLAAALIWYGSVSRMERWPGKRLRFWSRAASRDSATAGEPAEILAQKEAALEELAQQLDRREQALASQIVTYREWTEFPQPVDLADPEPTDERLAELVELDRRTIELLEEASKEIFDSILENRYVVEGKFQPAVLLQEAWQLADQVARIYQPASKNPLLETSTEQILSAVSRACLQFLVVVDELPLNVKELNINSLYGYVRRAVKAYGVYRRARPFLQIASKGYYLGRYAMGANPISMGALWMLQSVGSRGATALASRIVNRQALGLLNNVVRVIGFEVAEIYGGDFRHRDANWIYGAELTEALATFPVSGEMLTYALGEVGAIQLRSEYDRIYLYRCLAAAKSCLPKRYRATVVLSESERHTIVARLERFANRFLSQQDSKQQRWRRDLENRLATRFPQATVSTEALLVSQRQEALQSLAAYVFTVKEYAVADLPETMRCLSLFDELSKEEQEVQLDQWENEPPDQFEPPVLPVDSAVIGEYLDSLIQLTKVLTPIWSD